MREIRFDDIVTAVREACIKANTVLPDDLCAAIRAAGETEESPVGRAILGDLAENFTFAAQRGLPICQDTGMAVVFLELGQEARTTEHRRAPSAGKTPGTTPPPSSTCASPPGTSSPSPWPPRASAART